MSKNLEAVAEQTAARFLDASSGVPPARIIGVGASAGGLEALREMFRVLPSDLDLRIVVVQHLSPTHRSMLVSLLARESRLPVVEVIDGMEPRPNTIHITPPAFHIHLRQGLLRLVTARKAGTPKPSVDDFFISLAEECGALAMGVILSGTGHDGQAGVRRIHAVGGLVIAQDPATARYDGMPLAAIETKCVHHVLAPALIGRDIAELKVAVAAGSEAPRTEAPPLERISALVRRATGVEINLYKETTLQRRLKRRMGVTGCPDVEAYANFLKSHSEEIGRLMREMLISVTSFFRDAAAVKALAAALEELVRSKAELDELRIWVAGCATGEEAYSIAIVVAEIQRKLNRQLIVRVFATDLDEAAVERARRARFSSAVASKLPSEILDRYFTRGKDEYLAVKSLRDMLIFSVHNLITDPVFSRLDLVSCRNVLIYFRPELQAHLLESFYHAMLPDGLLFLGKSESTQHHGHLFAPLDEKCRIFRRGRVGVTPQPARRQTVGVSNRLPMKVVPRDRVTVFERLLRSMPGTVLPPSVLIDADLTVRHTFGDVSNWVRLGEGEFSTDLYRLAVRPLRVEVRSLIMKAQRDAKGFVEHVVSGRELERPVRISVLRLEEENGQPSMLLVSFRATRTKPARQSDQVERDAEHLTEVTQLEQQLASTREHLHTVIEELETSNEELQSLNEEMQSSNEELTSANEELETANEELQSTNEELTTVNEELENKTQEFAALNNDLLNVKNSLPHPVIVIDVRSRIMLFNDGAGEAFRLPEDSIGESLFAMPGIAMLGDLGDLAIDTRRVLESGETVERQIEGQRTGLLISSPYRGNDGERNGVVLMFIDNSRLRAAERSLALAHDQLRNAERFARETIDALPQAVCVIDSACRIVSVNRLWTSMMQAGGGSEDLCGVGADYGAVCARAASAGEDTAAAFLAGLRAMVAGTLDRFEKEYPCLTPSGMRWFIASITRFSELERRFWLVMHIEITERKVQERTILMQSLALDANTAGVFIADTGLPQLPIVYVNRAFETVTAMTRDQLIGRDFTSLFPAATTPLREAVEGGVDARFTVTLESGAEPRHAELAVRPIALGPGERAHFSGVVHDVTERVRSADALRLTLQREALALSFAEIGSFDWNVRSGSLKCSALQMQLLGLGNEEGTVEQAEFLGLVHPDDLRAFNDVLRFCIAGHSPFNLDYRVIWPDGSTHWLRSRGNSTTDANSAPVSVLCLTQDITSAKESEMRARFLAHHDPLTGLANRSLLEDRLQQAISGARRERRRVALVFLDLDRFKEINDVFGHHAGDELLKRVAERLQSSVRQTDSVCRHSGDEFIVLLPGIHDAEEAGRIAGKIQNTLRKPYSIAGRDLHVSGSMGIAIYPDDGESADVLIKNADAAMYQSKGTGRDSFEFFSPNMNAQLVRRIETARQLRNCIVDAQLELDYQPQIDIVTGDLVGIEALVRWRHPERGLLLPDEFIPHAEDADLIHEIGNWVIERACRQNLAWHAQGVSRVPVAVNVSPAQFRKSDFIDRLTAILGKTGLDPSLLELEITERLLMHHTDAATEVLGRCHALGVRLSIDDFGTGYSSLTYLQRFPMDRIKIDRSFVAAATQQKVAAAIVRAVIHLGRGLGQQIVAEGVETLDQLALLRSEGCDAFQGYLCTRPLPAEALGTFILDKLPVSWREARHA